MNRRQFLAATAAACAAPLMSTEAAKAMQPKGPTPVELLSEDGLYDEWEAGMWLDCQDYMSPAQRARLLEVEREMDRRECGYLKPM